MGLFKNYWSSRTEVTTLADADSVIFHRAADGEMVEITKADLATEVGGGAVDSVNGATGVVVLDADDIDDAATTNKFADTASVTAAGALMDSEVDADIKTLSLPANTTISAFGATLIDDADAATARATLGVSTGSGDLVASNNLSDVADAATARDNLLLDESRTGVVYLNDFAGANADAKFAAALAYAAAQTNIPWIEFPVGITALTGTYTPFSGMKICGAGGRSGAANYEVNSAKNVLSTLNLTGNGTGTNSLFYSTATIYNINVRGLTIRSNNDAQFWHQPSGTLYASTFHDLNFYGIKSAFGNTASKCLVTFCQFTGTWAVTSGNTGETVFHFGGSDSTFWQDGSINLQNGNSPTTKDNYQMHFDGVSKSVVGFIYLSNNGGWRGLKVSGSGKSLVFNGSIFEGYADNPGAHACLIRVEGGNVIFNGIWASYAMLAPTFYGGSASGVIEVTGGNVIISGVFYERASATSSYGSVGAVAESVPLIHQSGGVLRARDAVAVGTWSGSPLITTTSGTVTADSSFTTSP